MLHFNDGNNWMSKRIQGVRNAYKIPSDATGVGVDVGANVGAFAVVNNMVFDRIICIEPATETLTRCKISTSQFDNVEVHQFAVSNNSNEVLKLRHYKDGAQSGNATTLDNPAWYNDSDYEEVTTISLEDIYTRFNIDKIGYLKVDCEGGEYDFLMNKDLSEIEYIAAEVHPKWIYVSAKK